MSGKLLFTKIALAVVVAGAASLPTARQGFAASVTGKITAFHLSGDNAGGEVCGRHDHCLVRGGHA
jgi:hypothetical protein